MTARHATTLLAASMALRVTSSAAQVPPDLSPNDPPNTNSIIGPPPPRLSGLWALGRRCGVRRGWLHITATTLAFADTPPVRYDYIPESPHHLIGYITIRNSNDGYIYDLQTHTVSVDTGSSDPDRLYYPCFGLNPGWPPRRLEDPDAALDKLIARLVHVRLSDNDVAELFRIYFIKGDAAFRQLARLLNTDRRAEVRTRFRRFEQEMATDPPFRLPTRTPP